MANIEHSTTYVGTRNGHYYFRRKLSGRLLRVALKTSCSSIARQRAAHLYAYTNQLTRLGLAHSELLRLSKIRAEQLYEDGLTAPYSRPLALPSLSPFALQTTTAHLHATLPQPAVP